MMKECPRCLGQAWHVDGNTWECTVCGREFEATPEQETEKQKPKKCGDGMGKAGVPWTVEQRQRFTETLKKKGLDTSLTAEQKKEAKKKRDRDWHRNKAAERKKGARDPKSPYPYRRRIPDARAPAASEDPCGFSFCCMRCGFRHELTAEGLRALREGDR